MSTRTGFPTDVRARLEVEAREIIARYPRSRSALLPMLHLMQAEEGYVSPHGIELCAEILDITAAEVAAVVTFYTMYKRRPNGTYSVGVCTNTLCAVMGGDQTTEDGTVTLEHLECNAACDYAPVMMVNWEFFDNQTPESAVGLVDGLRSGDTVTPTRGATLCTFKEVSRVLAGFPDGRADEGPAAGPATLAGLQIFREQEQRDQKTQQNSQQKSPTQTSAGPATTPPTGYGKDGGPSGDDSGTQTAASDPANPTQAPAETTPNTTAKDGAP